MRWKKIDGRLQGETFEKTVRVRGGAPARRLQERLLPRHRRVELRLQGEIQDHGNYAFGSANP
jgi:hypothetical protein